MRTVINYAGLSIMILSMLSACTNELSEFVDYEQQIKENNDFQKGVEVARVKYQKMDSVIATIMEYPVDGLVEKIIAMSAAELDKICGNNTIEDISTLSFYCADALVDNLSECTSAEDARNILSMGDDFFYIENSKRYEMLVNKAKVKPQIVKSYMYQMAGVLSEAEVLFARQNISRAIGTCEDIITHALAEAALASVLEKDIAEVLPEESLADMLISLGLDAVDAAITAHKYHECKMGIVLP